MLLWEMDRKLGLTRDLAKHLNNTRNLFLIEHTSLEKLRRRFYGLCLEYEDLNDHQTLRNDTAIQTAIEKDSPLASPLTLCRFENSTHHDPSVVTSHPGSTLSDFGVEFWSRSTEREVKRPLNFLKTEN